MASRLGLKYGMWYTSSSLRKNIACLTCKCMRLVGTVQLRRSISHKTTVPLQEKSVRILVSFQGTGRGEITSLLTWCWALRPLLCPCRWKQYRSAWSQASEHLQRWGPLQSRADLLFCEVPAYYETSFVKVNYHARCVGITDSWSQNWRPLHFKVSSFRVLQSLGLSGKLPLQRPIWWWFCMWLWSNAYADIGISIETWHPKFISRWDIACISCERVFMSALLFTRF